MTVQEERKSIAEKQFLVRVPMEFEAIVEALQKDWINGQEVTVKSQAEVCREAFVRGLKEMQRERGVRL